MKVFIFLMTFLVIYENAGCKETEFEGYERDDANNLTYDEDSQDMLANLMRPQRFTPGTLLGVIVASIVVVIGSFLVLWRLCCEVEMRITREVMEPLQSISQSVANSPTSSKRSVSCERLLGHACSSSVLEVA